MIDLYTWTTPNGRKVSIMLEELGLPYKAHPINISKNEQFDPDFLKIAPNNRIPAIVDHAPADGGAPVSVFESGAIRMYLAEKAGSALLPTEMRKRVPVLEWTMWQMGGVGPMFGQAHHFRRMAGEKVPYGVKRYTDETHRLYGVADRRLAGNDYLAGADYTIADVITYPWFARWEWHGIDWADFPNVKRWFDLGGSRPAVQRGMDVAKPA